MRCLSVALPVAALLAFVPSTEAGPNAKTVKIAASASPWTVVGSRVGITGSVKPHPAGLEVTLQQRHGTGWLPVGKRNVRPDGAFSFVARPDKVGLAIYRVVTSKGTDFVGSSDRVAVRVLHWTYLDSSEEFAYLGSEPGRGRYGHAWRQPPDLSRDSRASAQPSALAPH